MTKRIKRQWNRLSGIDKAFLQSMILFFAMMFMCVLILLLYLPSSCATRTRDIGFAHRWGFQEGCQIEVETDKWIALENYRYVENEDKQ